MLEDFSEDEADEFHDGYVPIVRDGGGNCWLLDTRDAACPVLFWSHESMEATHIAASFGAWIEMIVDDADWMRPEA